MHFRCICGHRISDTSDNLPYSARLVADVDLYDYWEAWERTGRGQVLGRLSDPMDYEKIIYQCEECGRLYFDDPEDPSRFISFFPEDKNVMVTGPVQGDSWRGYIYGFSDLGMERSIGSCFTNWNYGSGEEYREFDSYDSMREYFDAKLDELREADKAKSAWVNKDGETVFRWDLEDVEPAQQKFEVYLTEDERSALEGFWREHGDCKNKYPRDSKGWNYAYEAFPGICGADDRCLKVTCLRCGKSLESADGRIIERDDAQEEKGSDSTLMVLDVLHERGTREIRSETISMPHRYYDIAETVGYVRGLLDARRLEGTDAQLTAIFQHVIARIVDSNESTLPPDLRNLIKTASVDGQFDWVIEDVLPMVKRTLREDFGALEVPWADEPDIERG